MILCLQNPRLIFQFRKLSAMRSMWAILRLRSNEETSRTNLWDSIAQKRLGRK
jgi:hypothetical protein